MDGYDIKAGKRRSNITELFLPPPAAWLFYFVIGGLFLVIVNIAVIWHYFFDQVVGQASEANQIIYNSTLGPLFNYADKLNRPLLMLFWGGIGLVTYLLLLACEKIISSFSTQVRRSNYLQGGTIKPKHYWRRTFSNNLTFIGMLFVWLLVIMFFFYAALPWLSRTLLYGVYNSSSIFASIGRVFLSLVASAACVYLLLVVSRLLHDAWAAFHS